MTFALAETYDPNVLAAWGARGIVSDVIKAKVLYRKALELGIARAHARIEALDGLVSAGLAATGTQQPLSLGIAPQLHAEPASRVRLPIDIRPPEAIQRNSFVRIRGLPPAAALSEGHAIAPGAWAVPLVALPTLSIILPDGVQGQAEVAISLVNIDGSVLAETRTLLVVAPQLPSPHPAPPSAATPSGGSGFVAVVASKKSRIDALKAFADLQAKYVDVLGGKTPDVQEANLGNHGVWYRVYVGPPGSREAASGVCSALKSAGHSGCWVAAY